MNIRVALLLAALSTVTCGPSGHQNVLVGDDEGEYVDSGENELYDNNGEYEEEYENKHNGTDEYEEKYEDIHDGVDEYEEEHEDRHNGTGEYKEEYEDIQDWTDEFEEEHEDMEEEDGENEDTDDNELYKYEDEDEEEDDDMPDGTDEEDGEYIELPDWMDADLDQLPIDKISMLNSAKNLPQLMTLLELTNEQRNKLEETGPVEIGARTVAVEENAGCKPELEVVKLEPPPEITYFPQCFRLPRCGGCCTTDLLSCQPISTNSIKVKVLKKKTSRSRRSTGRSNRNRRALGKYTMVEQVEHVSCGCQCRIKEHHCDKSIQEYKEAECACVCKNRDKKTECGRKNTHYWDVKSCSCKCNKIRECSTGEEFDQNTCRCAAIASGVRNYNSVTSKYICKPSCGNGRVRCQCKKGWKGKQCNKPKKSGRRPVKLLPTPTPSSRPTVIEAICDPGCVHGKCVSPDTCECQRGWRGDQCKDPICDPGCVYGSCVSPDTCECQRDWRGDQCQEPICDSGCVHGRCVSPDTCECQEGWRGDQCQNPICDPGCVHGSCVSPDTCDCQEGWRGKKCKKYTCEFQKRRGGNQCQDGCSCIPIGQCEPLLSLAKARTPENRKILMKAKCGASRYSIEVCCPESPSPLPKPLAQTSLPAATSSPTSLLPSYCGHPAFDNDRIFGGKEVKLGKYPWMALLGYTGCGGPGDNPLEVCYHCGGSVINERYVLTAAHCVTGLKRSKKLYEVVLGEWDLATDIDCDQNDICLPAPLRYGAKEVIFHPKYSTRGTFSDDIALIRLDGEPVKIDSNSASFIRAVCLPEPSMDIHQVKQTYGNGEKFMLSVAGWGTTENSSLSEKLLEVKLPLIENSECNTIFKGTILPEQICAGGQLGEDSCRGDSGGPLVLPGRNATDPYIQVGIVSYGKGCGRQNTPGIYTDVSKYRQWIEENLKP